ncbi:hypothetical protein ACFYUV_20670 [Nonomuraea sp. NPDC003560]|uniref:hypothetical protein n=1 Tax=Nonomuraea sp. NPDC003560 TaxID=3364341 RepID=UPI0036A508F3
MADDLRRRYAEAIRSAADFSIMGEWICCDPINPDHELCVQGGIARQMLAAVLTDDPERLFVPSKLVNAVMAVRDEGMESLRELAADYARIVSRLQDAADRARTLAGEHAECDDPCWEHMPAIVAALDASLPPEEET